MKLTVGKHIRDLRIKAGYSTISAFAEALDVHPNSVGELERGDNWLSPEMLQKLMELFKAPAAFFYPGEDVFAQKQRLIRAILDCSFDEIQKLLLALETIERNRPKNG